MMANPKPLPTRSRMEPPSPIPINSSPHLRLHTQALAGSLDLAERPDDAYFNKLVRIMTTRCMTQAVYFGSGDLGEGVGEYPNTLSFPSPPLTRPSPPLQVTRSTITTV